MTPTNHENVQHIRKLIDEHQRATHSDGGRHALRLGAAMVVVGVGCMLGGVPFAFALTCLVWGSVLATASLVVGTKIQRHRTEQLEVLCQALSDRAAGVV